MRSPTDWIGINLVRARGRECLSECFLAVMCFFHIERKPYNFSQQITQNVSDNLCGEKKKMLINMQKLQCIKLQLLIENWHLYKYFAGKGNMVCNTSSIETHIGLLFIDVFIHTKHTPISKPLQ